jgi:hypothetical protein
VFKADSSWSALLVLFKKEENDDEVGDTDEVYRF